MLRDQVDALSDLAAQERQERHDQVRGWQQRASIVLAVFLAIFPIAVANLQGPMLVVVVILESLGFASSFVALWPVRFRFPSTLTVAAEPKQFAGKSDDQLRAEQLVDAVIGVEWADDSMRRVRAAAYSAQVLALLTVLALGLAMLEGGIHA